MLKFDINKYQMRQAVVCGALDDIIAECAGFITFLYGTLCEQSEDAGRLFKESLIHLIQDEQNVIFDASMAKHMRGDAQIKGGGVFGNEKIDEEELVKMLDNVGLMSLDNDEKAEIMRMLCSIGKDEDDSEDSSIGKIVNSSFGYPPDVDTDFGEDGAENED